MKTATIATRSRTARIRRSTLSVLALTLVTATALAAPAAAVQGPNDMAVEEPDDPDFPKPPKPTLHLTASPVCEPTGIAYDADLDPKGELNAPFNTYVEWNHVGGNIGQIVGLNGFHGTVEGTYELVAVAQYPGDTITSNVVSVTIDCSEPDDDPKNDPEDEPGDSSTEVDGDIVRGNPNFTG